MDYVDCNGSETGLWESWYYYVKYCSSFTHYYGCSHTDDVGVRCQPGRFGVAIKLDHHFSSFLI